MIHNINPYKTIYTGFLTFDFIRVNGHGILKLNYDLMCGNNDKFRLCYYKADKIKRDENYYNVVVMDQFIIDSKDNNGITIYCYVVESILDQNLLFNAW